MKDQLKEENHIIKKLAEYLKKIQRVELKNRITQTYSVSNTEICIRTKKKLKRILKKRVEI